MAGSSSIQVVVRLRPMNDKEEAEGTLPVISTSASQKTVTVIKGIGSKQARSSFQFDNVFSSFSNQSEIFTATLQPVIADVLKGYETCVFAYGQTGTGKTHTMEGELNDPDQYGVIPRSAQALFDALDSPDIIESHISCSYLEIYNEELRDLLDPSDKKQLGVMNTGKGVECRGLSKEVVTSAKDVLTLMQQAAQSRRVGETRMNRHSSRSHCIFTLSVNASKKLPNGSVLESHGKLHMVDLAGSESAKTAELKDSSAREQAAREQERRNINKSLLTLGRVITSLKEQSNRKKKTMQIPYRDSKLTRLLQEALGGHCKTVIIATISPSILNLQESLQTLNYAQAANGIQNKASASSFLSVAGSQNSALHDNQGDHFDSKNGAVERWQEMEIRMEHMQHEVEEARQALAKNYMHQQELTEKAEIAEREQQRLQIELDKTNHDLLVVTTNLETERQAKELVQEELQETQTTLQQTAAILQATQETEVALTSEARALLSALKFSLSEGENLHNLLQVGREEKVQMRNSTRKFHDTVLSILKQAVTTLKDLATNEDKNEKQLEGVLSDAKLKDDNFIETAQTVVADIATAVGSLSNTIKDDISNSMLPNYESLSSNIQSALKVTNDIVSDGELKLAERCVTAEEELDTFDHLLDEQMKKHDKASQKTQKEIEGVLKNVQEEIEAITKRAESALGSVLERSTQHTAEMQQLIGGWNKAGVDATRSLLENSDDQILSLDKATDLLDAETSRHHNMRKELSLQAEFLKAKRQSQLSTLSHQSRELEDQKAQIEASKQSQADLCKQITGSIMNGVKKLLSEQLELVTSDIESRSEKLFATQQNLLTVNQSLELDSKEFFNSLSTTNKLLSDENNSLEDTNSSILVQLKESRQAFSGVHELAEKLQSDQETILENAGKLINTRKSLNVTCGEICERIAADRQNCITNIENATHKAAKESISTLSNEGHQTMLLMKEEILQNAKPNIRKIIQPRDEVLQQVSQNLNSIGDMTQSQVADLNKLSKKVLEATKKTSDFVSKTDTDFKSKTSIHRSMSNKNHVCINDMLQSNGNEFKNLVSSCKENLSDLDSKTTVFSHDEMKIDTAVPDVSPIVPVNYSESLSSTADRDEILKKSNLSTASNSKEAVDVCNTSTDTTETKSSDCSKSRRKVTSPVLMEKSLNRKNSESQRGVLKKRGNAEPGRVTKRKKRV